MTEKYKTLKLTFNPMADDTSGDNDLEETGHGFHEFVKIMSALQKFGARFSFITPDIMAFPVSRQTPETFEFQIRIRSGVSEAQINSIIRGIEAAEYDDENTTVRSEGRWVLSQADTQSPK